ncbi:MAG: hypothetical protein V4665_01405 [Patescibacteria group bacterium]
MSFNDDEELKIGEFADDTEDELDLGTDLDGPLEDDLLAHDDENDEDFSDGFAGLDGSSSE